VNNLFLTTVIGAATGICTPFIAGSMLLIIDWLNSSLRAFLSLTVIAGMLLAYLLWRFSKVIPGSGTDIYASLSIKIRPVDSAFKYISTILTIGFGGSGGLVGPLFFISSGSSFLVSVRNRTAVKIASGAGMVSAYTGAPLTAAVLACEYTHKDGLDYRYLMPALFSSVIARWFSSLLRITPVFFIHSTRFQERLSFSEVILIVTLGVIFGGAGLGMYFLWKLYGKLLRRVSSVFLSFALSGVVLCGIGIVFGSEVLGLRGAQNATQPLAFALGKAMSSVVTIGGGGSAGFFTPCVLVGEHLGMAFSQLGFSQSVCVVVGISAMISSVLNAPLAAILLPVELLGVSALIPAVLGSTVSYLIYRRFRIK